MNLPTLRIHNPRGKRNYVYEGDLTTATVEDIAKFIGDWKAGKLIPHIQSEPVPDVATVNGLTTVVGSTWKDIVMDDTKDVFIEYYAPWCGHCKALEPIWKELGEKTKDIDDLVIAKMDATLNEVQGLDINGFPTVKFHPKGGKPVHDYKGKRGVVGDFMQWLNEYEDSTAFKEGLIKRREEREAEKEAAGDQTQEEL